MLERPQLRYRLGMAYKGRGDAARTREELRRAVAKPTACRGPRERLARCRGVIWS
jgi:hypothetical protein